MTDVDIPSYRDLMYPTLVALAELGGSGDRIAIADKVIANVGITDEQLAVEFPEEAQHTGSKVHYRLGWSRSYLKKLGAVEAPERGTWELTDEGKNYLNLEGGAAELLHREHELRVGKRPELFLKRAQEAPTGDPLEMSVRGLLSEWGVKRRGAAVTERIIRDLASVGLVSDPPFDTVGLDTQIKVRPAVESASATAHDGAPDAELAVEALPTHPTTVTIGTLPSANSEVVSVTPDDTLLTAQSKMESNDFSQLAVLEGPRNLTGAISWESIARSALYGQPPTNVRDAMERSVKIVSEDEPLLEQVGLIAEAGFVFVRDRTNLISGIVTAADLSAEFVKLANPFLLIGEIEGWLRRIVDRCFTADELAGYVDPDDPDRQIEAAENLTFGEYVRLFQDLQAWEDMGLRAERKVFVDHLDDVRQVRNSIMHFSPDPLDPESIASIESMLSWVRKLAESGAS